MKRRKKLRMKIGNSKWMKTKKIKMKKINHKIVISLIKYKQCNKKSISREEKVRVANQKMNRIRVIVIDRVVRYINTINIVFNL